MDREKVYMELRDNELEIELGENVYLTEGGFEYYKVQIGKDSVLFAIALDIGDYMESHVELHGERDEGIHITEYKLKAEIDGMPVAGVRWLGNEPDEDDNGVVDLLYSKHETSNRVTLDLTECDMRNIVFADEMFSEVNRHGMKIIFPEGERRLRPVGCNSMFEKTRIENRMDLSAIDFSETIEMRRMMYQSNIRALKFNENEHYKKIKDISECFYNVKVDKMDLGMFEMSGDVFLNMAFHKCRNLNKVILPKMNNCIAEAANLFDGCTHLTSVDFRGNWRLINGTRILKGCYALGDIDSDSFFHDMDITNMFEALSACTKIAGEGIRMHIGDLHLNSVRDETALVRNMLGEAVYRVINLDGVVWSGKLTLDDCVEIPPFRERSSATIIIKREYMNANVATRAKNISYIELSEVDIDRVNYIRTEHGVSDRGILVIGVD